MAGEGAATMMRVRQTGWPTMAAQGEVLQALPRVHALLNILLKTRYKESILNTLQHPRHIPALRVKLDKDAGYSADLSLLVFVPFPVAAVCGAGQGVVSVGQPAGKGDARSSSIASRNISSSSRGPGFSSSNRPSSITSSRTRAGAGPAGAGAGRRGSRGRSSKMSYRK